VTYVATAAASDDDPDFARRIAVHRARRPPEWQTVELGLADDLAGELAGIEGPVIVDSIGTWVAGHPDFAVDLERLTSSLIARRAPTVLVSEEVGWGVHPSSKTGRAFRDAVGTVNKRLADVSGNVLLVVAGRVLELPRAHRPHPGSLG